MQLKRWNNLLISDEGIVYDLDKNETEQIIQVKRYYYIKGRAVHRLVYQLFVGPIPSGYDLHHINICSRDNRLQNLILMPEIQHYKLHRYLKHNSQFKKLLKSKGQPHLYECINEPKVRKTISIFSKEPIYCSSNHSFSIKQFEEHWSERKKELRLDELTIEQLKKLI